MATVIDSIADGSECASGAGSKSSAAVESWAPAQRSAHFSRDRRYRYLLSRTLADLPPSLAPGIEGDAGKDRLLFVMLNPSVADAHADDPTLRRCMAFARQWGFSKLEVVNLYARICTDPRLLFEDGNPAGPRNDAWLRRAAGKSALIICAWGASGGGMATSRARAVIRLLQATGQPLHHLGLTASGAPRHPLYVHGSTKPVPWNPDQL